MWSAEAIRREIAQAPCGGHLARPDTRIEESDRFYRIVTPSCAGTWLNEVIRARLPDVEPTIHRVLAEYRSLGVPFKWVVAWDSDDAYGEALARMLVSWPTRGMYADPRLRIAAPSDVEVRRIGTEALPLYADTFARGWDVEPAEYLSDCERALTRANVVHRFFVAFADGEPVGVAAYVAKPRSAYFTSAVVLQRWRGRGIYRALLAARLSACTSEGLDLVTTQAREASSAPILERLGFATSYRFRVFAD